MKSKAEKWREAGKGLNLRITIEDGNCDEDESYFEARVCSTEGVSLHGDVDIEELAESDLVKFGQWIIDTFGKEKTE